MQQLQRFVCAASASPERGKIARRAQLPATGLLTPGNLKTPGEQNLDLIASAIDRGIPVIIGVPDRNLEAWRSFAGEFANELPDDAGRVMEWAEGAAAV